LRFSKLKAGFEQPERVTHLERDLISSLDRIHQLTRLGHAQLEAHIATYELAARMQVEASNALDLSQETAATLAKDLAKGGRDHSKNAICTWMDGGGVKRGFVLGSTDDLGFAAVEDRVSVEDWHATILHLLGLHHEELFVERNGLKERLTGVTKPRIVREVIA
jgi:hypothetical protein